MIVITNPEESSSILLFDSTKTNDTSIDSSKRRTKKKDDNDLLFPKSFNIIKSLTSNSKDNQLCSTNPDSKLVSFTNIKGEVEWKLSDNSANNNNNNVYTSPNSDFSNHSNEDLFNLKHIKPEYSNTNKLQSASWEDEFLVLSPVSSVKSNVSSQEITPLSDDSSDTTVHSSSNSPDSSDKLHKCPHCDSSFKIRGYLTRHIKKHSLEKAYRCPFYGDKASSRCHATGGFSRRDTFKTHLKSRHFKYPPGIKASDRQGKSGWCGICGERFLNNEIWVERHIETGKCKGLPDAYVRTLKIGKKKTGKHSRLLDVVDEADPSSVHEDGLLKRKNNVSESEEDEEDEEEEREEEDDEEGELEEVEVEGEEHQDGDELSDEEEVKSLEEDNYEHKFVAGGSSNNYYMSSNDIDGNANYSYDYNYNSTGNSTTTVPLSQPAAEEDDEIYHSLDYENSPTSIYPSEPVNFVQPQPQAVYQPQQQYQNTGFGQQQQSQQKQQYYSPPTSVTTGSSPISYSDSILRQQQQQQQYMMNMSHQQLQQQQIQSTQHHQQQQNSDVKLEFDMSLIDNLSHSAEEGAMFSANEFGITQQALYHPQQQLLQNQNQNQSQQFQQHQQPQQQQQHNPSMISYHPLQQYPNTQQQMYSGNGNNNNNVNGNGEFNIGHATQQMYHQHSYQQSYQEQPVNY